MTPRTNNNNNDQTWLDADLYRELRARVIRTLGFEQDAEDALHEVLAALQRACSAPLARPLPDNLPAYVVSAAKNRLVDALRQRRGEHAKRDRLAGDLAAREDDSTSDPESEAIHVERAVACEVLVDCIRGELRRDADASIQAAFADLQQVLATRLTDEHWVVLRSRGLHGHGFEICAALIRSSVGTAHNRWRDAIGIVRSVLSHHGVIVEEQGA